MPADAGIYAWIMREETQGHIFAGDDGCYLWDPSTAGRGFLNEYALHEMMKYLQAKNALLQWHHQHDPAIGGSE